MAGVEESKTPMTDEERAALCKKLDEELDDFIDSLEKKTYTDGWNEETWEEEMEQHPFFMKSTPDGQLSPLAEGLAKLKYDPEENTPVELATNYKEDGNFNFKHKNYRLTILGYTEGLRVKCADQDLNASLYNNRAAAHWHLKNYRSALLDSEKALSMNPDHIKARIRAAKAACESAKYDTSIKHCQKILETQPSNEEILELMKKVANKKQKHDRDLRKRERLDQKKSLERDAVIQAVLDRKIRVMKCEDDDDLDLSKLEPVLPGAQESMVSIKDGILYWPMLLFYPEFQTTDLVKECPENVSLLSQIEQIFPAPWDLDNKYSPNTVNCYFEGYDGVPRVVDPRQKLGDLLSNKYYLLKAGTAAFILVPRGSQAERHFLESYKR